MRGTKVVTAKSAAQHKKSKTTKANATKHSQAVSTASLDERSAGVLLHITSLPSPGPIGDLGAAAHAFVDLLSALHQRWWQTLPVNPIGAGNSPYSTVCSLAGDPLLIDLVALVNDGLLKKREIPKLKKEQKRCHYQQARKLKLPLLKLASTRFDSHDPKYLAFCKANDDIWLHDYALYMVLSDLHKSEEWSTWKKEYRLRSPQALAALAKDYAQEILAHKFAQFKFAEQWTLLKQRAQLQGVGLIGDIPIFVGLNSSDVWANQRFFAVNEQGKAEFVAGVPPDYFNADGQVWGNALYRWDELKKDGFKWWIRRFQQLLTMFDAVRIDHFIGFHRYWEIPAGNKTAKIGTWRYAPGDELFAAVRAALGSLPFIAEDLGLLTPEVSALRDKYDLPSMKVLQFGFTSDGGPSHKTHSYIRNCVVYTGTHDNDTTVGWYNYAVKHAKDKSPSFDLALIHNYLDCDRKSVATAMIDTAFKSVAKLAVIPWQDVLALDERNRMNVPGTATGNWEWRFKNSDMNTKLLKKYAMQTLVSGRAKT